MAEIARIEVQCISCKTWFKSPIQSGTPESFDTSTLEGNNAQCEACGRMSPCNKENMRWARSDGNGGWRGIDTR